MTDSLFSALDTSSWEGYKKSLGKAVDTAEDMGISDRMINRMATELGDYLTVKATPDLPENRLLHELWCVADDKEKHAISSLLIKVAQQS